MINPEMRFGRRLENQILISKAPNPIFNFQKSCWELPVWKRPYNGDVDMCYIYLLPHGNDYHRCPYT